MVSFAQVAPGPCGPVPRDLVLLWLEPKLSVIVTLKLCCDIVAYATFDCFSFCILAWFLRITLVSYGCFGSLISDIMNGDKVCILLKFMQ